MDTGGNWRYRRLLTLIEGLRDRFAACLSREDGQGLVEYGLILMMVGIACLVLVTTLGHQTNGLYSNISNGLAGH